MAESRDEERDPADIAGGGYQEVALRFMAAVSGASGPERMILDVGNESAGSTLVPSLPGDLVVEVPCLVDAGGVNPRAVGAPDPSQLGLMAQLRGSERLIARAALTGSRDLAWQGFALHPWSPRSTWAGDCWRVSGRRTGAGRDSPPLSFAGIPFRCGR